MNAGGRCTAALMGALFFGQSECSVLSVIGDIALFPLMLDPGVLAHGCFGVYNHQVVGPGTRVNS